MAQRLDANATLPVRKIVYQNGTSTGLSNTTATEETVKNILIAAFQAIPNQGGGTATVGAIVTALQTLP